jgi:hypothetical protein
MQSPQPRLLKILLFFACYLVSETSHGPPPVGYGETYPDPQPPAAGRRRPPRSWIRRQKPFLEVKILTSKQSAHP